MLSHDKLVCCVTLDSLTLMHHGPYEYLGLFLLQLLGLSPLVLSNLHLHA